MQKQLSTLIRWERDEKQKVGCKTELRFYTTEKASPIEENAEKN